MRGAANVYAQSSVGSPEVKITLERERLQRFGFQPLAVLETIQAAYLGVTVAQTYDGAGVFDVSVVLDSSLRQDAGTLAQLWIRNGEGPQLPLRELARI